MCIQNKQHAFSCKNITAFICYINTIELNLFSECVIASLFIYPFGLRVGYDVPHVLHERLTKYDACFTYQHVCVSIITSSRYRHIPKYV